MAAALGRGDVPPRPSRYVADRAGALRPGQAEALNARLAAFERETSTQIVVYIDRKLPEGTALDDWTNRAYREWGLGTKSRSNGVLFALFLEDRKMRMEVGYGLEGAVPDAMASRILNDVVVPRVRAGDVPGGVEAGVEALQNTARHERLSGSGRTAAESQEARSQRSWTLVTVGAFTALALGAALLGWFKLARRRTRAAICALLFLAGVSVAAPPIPPAPTSFVTDRAGVLSPSAASALETRLRAFEAETSDQFLVYIEPRVPEGTTLEEYTVAAARAFRAGQKARKNGLVLFVFPSDRAARFEVGYGLEGALPDALAGRILSERMFPRFRAGDFEGGISAGVEAAIAATKGEYKGTGRRPSRQRGFPPSLLLFAALFLLPLLLGGRRRSYWYVGGGGFGSGGFGGFGGGGGGFSGGGGSFGGGGASGRW